MRYLLDTNAVIELLDDPEGRISQRVREHRPIDIGLSSVVVHELYFGAFKSRFRDQNLALVDGLLFEVVPFDREDAREAGEIRAALSTKGMSIGPFDALIAGQARSRALTLVTRNVREFERVENLRIEDWETE